MIAGSSLIRVVTGALTLTLLLALLICAPARAGYLPSSPGEFADKATQFSMEGMYPLFLGLFNWTHVTTDIKSGIESSVESLFEKSIESVELGPVPEGFPDRFEREGVAFERNTELEYSLKFTLVDEAGNYTTKYLPFGSTSEGYAFAASVPVDKTGTSKVVPRSNKSESEPPKTAPVIKPAVETPKAAEALTGAASAESGLTIRIEMPEGVDVEIACAYFDETGKRRVITFKATSTMTDTFSGREFDVCAAKKRSGKGEVRVVLEQSGKSVFSDSTGQIDQALVFRRQP